MNYLIINKARNLITDKFNNNNKNKSFVSSSPTAKKDSVDLKKKESSNQYKALLAGASAYLLSGFMLLAIPILISLMTKKKTDKELGISFDKVENLTKKIYENPEFKLKEEGLIYGFLDKKMDKNSENIFNHAKKIYKNKHLTFNSDSAKFEMKLSFENYDDFRSWIDKSKSYRSKLAFALKENASAILLEFGNIISKQNKYINLIDKARFVQRFYPVLFLLGLVHKDKKTDKKQDILNKTTGFIKKHIVILSSLFFIPTLLSKGIVINKVQELIKKNDKSLLEPLKKEFALYYSSSLVPAILAPLSAMFGIYAKDKINEYFSDSVDKKQNNHIIRNAIVGWLITNASFAAMERLSLNFINKKFKTDKEMGISFSKVKNLTEKMYESPEFKLKKENVFYAFLGEKMDAKSEKAFIDSKVAFKETFKNYADFRKYVKDAKGGGVSNDKGNYAVALKEKASVIFHELGHVIVRQNKFTNLIVKASSIKRFILVVLLAGLIHKDKPNNKNENKFDKITGFIKKHAGMLSFSLFLPMLFDEGFASMKALNFIKKHDKSILPPVRKNLAWAFSSYLALAVSMSLGVKLGLFVKDKLYNKDK